MQHTNHLIPITWYNALSISLGTSSSSWMYEKLPCFYNRTISNDPGFISQFVVVEDILAGIDCRKIQIPGLKSAPMMLYAMIIVHISRLLIILDRYIPHYWWYQRNDEQMHLDRPGVRRAAQSLSFEVQLISRPAFSKMGIFVIQAQSSAIGTGCQHYSVCSYLYKCKHPFA